MILFNRIAVVPLGRGPRQSARILETLAGLTVEPRGDINAVLMDHCMLAAGVSCVAFSYEENETTRLNMVYLKHRQVPAISIFNKKEQDMDRDRFSQRHAVYTIDDLRAPGAHRP